MSIRHSLKEDMKKRGLQLIADPRVTKLMKNEQVLKAIMALAQVPGMVNDFTSEQTDRFAKTLQLGTAEDVRQLRRSIKRLEKQLAELADRLETRS